MWQNGEGQVSMVAETYKEGRKNYKEGWWQAAHGTWGKVWGKLVGEPINSRGWWWWYKEGQARWGHVCKCSVPWQQKKAYRSGE